MCRVQLNKINTFELIEILLKNNSENSNIHESYCIANGNVVNGLMKNDLI